MIFIYYVCSSDNKEILDIWINTWYQNNRQVRQFHPNNTSIWKTLHLPHNGLWNSLKLVEGTTIAIGGKFDIGHTHESVSYPVVLMKRYVDPTYYRIHNISSWTVYVQQEPKKKTKNDLHCVSWLFVCFYTFITSTIWHFCNTLLFSVSVIRT